MKPRSQRAGVKDQRVGDQDTNLAQDDEIVLECKDVSKSFQQGAATVQALQAINLKIKRGIVTGLIGPDAAGKTTLMRLSAGLMQPDQGYISVLGIDTMQDALTVQSRIGYMPQRFGLYEDLSVQENLDLYADLQGISVFERAPRYQELLRMTGLGDFTDRLAGRLSGGMKQKLGLACTLVQSPELLLLDEPTVGVDPVSRRELWAIVYRLVQNEGMSVLLSTAYLDEAERCAEVILLHEGRILGFDTPEKFSDDCKGNVYSVSLPGMTKRQLQGQLATLEGVMDTVIQGEQVRVVMASEAVRPIEIQLAERQYSSINDLKVSPVLPRFEDSFITLIKTDRGHQKVTSKLLQDDFKQSPEPNQAVIEVENLQRRFGEFYAVRNLSFDVRHGEVFGLLGANGAGKTTTFRMLCGLLPASAGRLQVAGVDLRHAAATARARIGYMSQKFSLYGNLNVVQNLNFFGNAYGLSAKQRAERIEWALTQFDLTAFANSESHSLSLGYKQRLALACALLHKPEILFLDEPTSGVDPLARREFWQRINSLTNIGVTVLVTTHFMEEAEYCDRLAIMAAGELLALGTPLEIKNKVVDEQSPEPSMEDAFIRLIENHEHKQDAA
ncbi:MAG: ABC transporter ATP-binding protein [Pseudomonadales bacterium]|nr:ABC transporter ATP-binding protein [Pseudomonadales bacterium]MCP5215038.1 ABC transporter ATP-binding protein [Pseudomonadales bacterium]